MVNQKSHRGITGGKFAISALLVLLLVVAIVVLGRMNTKHFEKTFVIQTQEHLQTIARTESQHIERRIIDIHDTLRVLAENPKVKESLVNGWTDKDGPVADDYLPEELVYKHLMKNISSLYRLDNKGIVQSRIPWTEGKAGNDYSFKPGVRMVLKAHHSYVSELFRTDSGIYCFSICYPVFDQKQFIGILRTVINLDVIHACLKDSDIGSEGYAWMMDNNGIVVSYPNTEYVGKNLITVLKEKGPSCDWSELENITKRMAKGEKGTGLYCSISPLFEKHEDADKITAFVPVRVINQLWSLGTVVEYDEISDPIQVHSRNVTAGTALFIIILFGAGSWFYKAQKEKAKLIIEAKSAEKLRLANTKLNKEITEHKKAEVKATGMAHILETSLNEIFIFNADTLKFIQVNEGARNNIGYDMEELKGLTPLDIKPDVTSEYFAELVELLRTHEKQIINFQTVHKRKNGSLYPVDVHLQLSSLGSQQVFVAIILDITERKKAEEELLQYASIVSSSSDMMAILDTNFVYLATNESYLKAFGMTKDQVIGHTIHDVFGQEFFETAIKLNAERCLMGNETRYEDWFQFPVYGSRFMVIRYSPYIGSEGSISGFIVNGRDITERKRAEEALETAKHKAESANIAKSRFLANMSHEIRTPMNIIIGFTDLLANEEMTEDQKEYSGFIQKAGKSLLGIIDDVLDYSRIEAGKLEINLENCSLKNLFEEIDSMMRLLTDEKGLDFKVIGDERLPLIIRTDSGRVRQCLVNLINNAIKFTDQGHIHLNVSLQDKDGESFIRFDVEDTGIGIPEDMQEHIFASFAQVDEADTRSCGGTGLGLAITKQLAMLLGGELTLTSEEDKGSVFSLLIPAGVDVGSQPYFDKDETVCKSSPEDYETHRLSGKVLVAEDIKESQLLVQKILKPFGLEVILAEDGKQVIEKAQEQTFDLILMDIQMPVMNGYEATRILRQEGLTIPIIALTAYAMEGDREKCLDAGCDDYITKPIDRDKLTHILYKYVGQVNAVSSA